MKNIIKIAGTAALAAVIIFSMTTCADTTDEPSNNGPTHYTGALKISKRQVWEGTNSNKISEVYKKFEGERGINVNVYWPDGSGKFNPIKNLGSGKIEKGLLTCEVPEPEADNLMEWDNFKFEFSAWNELACIPAEAKGNYLRLVTSNDEWLNREKMSGSSDSLWLESIWFVYVDTDCQITGTPSEGIRPGDAFYETPENLNLALKKGWNTVCRKQLLQGERGIEFDSMKLKNPNDFKWAIRPVHP
ncbi:MAG: hypothetical protein LBB89_00785 [Treponema sp.]|jgi:hypothetical protein|nr:hypothetical protein [Treponema sp.]